MLLMTTSDLPLRRIARGKVRDVYEVDAGESIPAAELIFELLGRKNDGSERFSQGHGIADPTIAQQRRPGV